VDGEPTYYTVLVVPVPNADAGPPFQGVPGMEGPAKEPMGRGVEEKREGDDRFAVRELLTDGGLAMQY